MSLDKTGIEAGLKTLADQFQCHFKGTVTPVNPDEDSFDVSATANAVTPTVA